MPHAVLWNSARVARDLGVLPGESWSSAFAINVFGVVVGNANWAGSGHARLCGVQKGQFRL